MAPPLVECVPNFSEARRPEIVEEIMHAVNSVTGVSLLDRHSDLDHNRTVLTFVGPPEGVAEAAFRAIAKAAELIDLEQHRGEHPRIGATDVVPFVPVSGVSMEECVELARTLGHRVGEELSIPVYLYEAAATRPERQNLENIRRGQYEGLKAEMGLKPEREPDFGPQRVGPAGATVIGARPFLIAFNVYLTTEDVTIAKKIAKAVRHSSGGLRYVKGLGLLVDGRAQVSMNLTNYHGTPVARVVELIRREAERYGVGIHHTELVGLIPQEALVDSAVWYLQLDQFEPEQVLEQRLAAAQQAEVEKAVEAAGEGKQGTAWGATGFLDALAAGTAAPGGGSASAYSGAAGAALLAMVARLTIGRKKYASVEDRMEALLERSESLRSELTAAIERDAQAFEAVMAAFRLPKGTPDEQAARSQQVESATFGAAQVPLEVARMAVEVMDLAIQAVSLGNLNTISDGAAGAAQARACLTGAAYNVRINLKDLQSHAAAQAMLAELRELEMRGARLEERVRMELVGRGGMVQG